MYHSFCYRRFGGSLIRHDVPSPVAGAPAQGVWSPWHGLGWMITAADEDAIRKLPADAWKPGTAQDGSVEEDKDVAEITHLMSRALQLAREAVDRAAREAVPPSDAQPDGL